MIRYLSRLLCLCLVLLAYTAKAQDPCKEFTWTPYSAQEPCKSIRVPRAIVIGYDVTGKDTVWHSLVIGPMVNQRYKSRVAMKLGPNTCDKQPTMRVNLEPCK